MEFLLWSTGRAVLDLVHFADDKVNSGVMKKKRIVVPGMRRLRKAFSSALSVEDSVDHTPDNAETGGLNIVVGDAYGDIKDAEHLPPTNAWQRFGNGVRAISKVLGSQASVFGFRVACATLSIAIVAFLEDTQAFFVQQRLVWAMIMIAIGMTVTAGAGVFGFIGRVAGTSKLSICLVTDYESHALIWLITISCRYVHELHNLVYRRWEDTWSHCISLHIYILRILFCVAVSAFSCHSHSVDGYTSLGAWL